VKKSEFKLSAAILVSLALWAFTGSPVFAQSVLVPAGSVWKYLDDGSNQGTLWRGTGFDDSAWSGGPAQLGYGDGDEATVVSYGPDPNNRYVTTYFRHSFDVADPSQFNFLQLRLLRDDGAVLYLNGTEIQRSNMPAGTISYVTLASSTVSGAAEDAFNEYYVDSSDLVSGINVIAVEVNQRRVTSSDISFDLEVFGLEELLHPVRKAPYLIYPDDNSKMQIVWQLYTSDTCHIEWGFRSPVELGNENTFEFGDDSQFSYDLGSEVSFEYGDDHQHSYTIADLPPATTCYYRVVAENDVFTGSFRTAPPRGESEIGFFAYGDTRSNPAIHDQVAGAITSAYAADPELKSLLISVGDLVADGDEEGDWDTEFFAPSYTNIQTMLAALPYQACRGNHEDSGVVFTKYFPYPHESPCYWSFDYGPAHFTVIDQYVSYSPGSAQHTWIVNDLSTTRKPWRFLVFHEPGWSAGGGHGNNTAVQNYIQRCASNMAYRSCLPGIITTTLAPKWDSIQHITTGGGGAPLHTPNLAYPYIVTAASERHFCAVKIDGEVLSFVAISVSGDTLDQFLLNSPVNDIEATVGETASNAIELNDAFPNPFNSATTVTFSLPSASRIELGIFNLIGQRVCILVDADLAAGQHRFIWNGTDDAGRSVSSGKYICRLRSDNQVLSRELVLIK